MEKKNNELLWVIAILLFLGGIAMLMMAFSEPSIEQQYRDMGYSEQEAAGMRRLHHQLHGE